MPGMYSMAEMRHALESSNGNVHAAFEFVQATGRATEELKEDYARIEALRAEIQEGDHRIEKLIELRQAELKYAKKFGNRAKRRLEKAETRRKMAEATREFEEMQNVIDFIGIASDAKDADDVEMPDADDVEMPDAGDAGDADADTGDADADVGIGMDPFLIQVALNLVKKKLTLEKKTQSEDEPSFKPFWYNIEAAMNATAWKLLRDDRVTLNAEWVPLDEKLGEPKPRVEEKGPFYVFEVDPKRAPSGGSALITFEKKGYGKKLSAYVGFRHGVLVTKATRNLPPLILKRDMFRFRLNKYFDDKLMDIVNSIIPGTKGVDIEPPTLYEKRGKGLILKKNNVLKISNVADDVVYFAFQYNYMKKPEFYAETDGTRLNDMGDAASNYLSPTTLDNIMKIFRAWQDYYDDWQKYSEDTLKQIAVLNQVSVGVRGGSHTYTLQIPDLEEDNSEYVTRAEANGDRDEMERQKKVALDQAAEQRLRKRLTDGEITYGTLMKKKIQTHSASYSNVYHEFYRVVPEGDLTDGKGGLAVRRYDEKIPSFGNQVRPSEENLRDEVEFVTGLKVVRDDEIEFESYTWYA